MFHPECEPAMGYELSILGCWRLSRDGKGLVVPVRMQRLVAFLAVVGPCARSYLCGSLWPETTDRRALDSLRVTIHLVGRRLPGLLLLEGGIVGLDAAVGVDLHREREAFAASANGLVAAHGVFSAGGVHGLGARPTRPEPELLPGWYEDWVIREQNTLRHARILHHARQGQLMLDAGDLRGAVEAADCALAHDPLDEWALEILVRAHLGLGSHGAARRALNAFRHESQLEHGQYVSPLLDSLEILLAADPPSRQVMAPAKTTVSR
jgi:DNA-binding SARP family transcriptional activator